MKWKLCLVGKESGVRIILWIEIRLYDKDRFFIYIFIKVNYRIL